MTATTQMPSGERRPARVRCGVLAGVVALTSCALAAAIFAALAVAAPSTVARCRPAGSRALLFTPTLRVYRTRTRGRGQAASDLVVACWLASARTTVLLAESPHDENNDVRLTAVKPATGSASVIGVSSSTVGVGLVETDLVQAFNVRSGRRLASNEGQLLDCEEGCRVKVFEFIVTPGGALAFIASDDPGSGFAGGGLYTIAPHGMLHVLEAGTAPQQPEPGTPTLTDLKYANGAVSWQSQGAAMSAPLS